MIIKKLRESRERLDLKQTDIARMLNVDNSTVSGWETGKDTIPLTKLILYANEFNYSLDYLFGISNKNKKYFPVNINLVLIGDRLKELRKNNKYTQKDIANKLNTTQSTISSYENGNNLINTTFLYNLSKIYDDISIDDLLGRKKD
jgi:transcriptional regulator with XRE-family HTH domain